LLYIFIKVICIQMYGYFINANLSVTLISYFKY
jgi:hypothetical protein